LIATRFRLSLFGITKVHTLWKDLSEGETEFNITALDLLVAVYWDVDYPVLLVSLAPESSHQEETLKLFLKSSHWELLLLVKIYIQIGRPVLFNRREMTRLSSAEGDLRFSRLTLWITLTIHKQLPEQQLIAIEEVHLRWLREILCHGYESVDNNSCLRKKTKIEGDRKALLGYECF
jgi:hypothetical protein